MLTNKIPQQHNIIPCVFKYRNISAALKTGSVQFIIQIATVFYLHNKTFNVRHFLMVVSVSVTKSAI